MSIKTAGADDIAEFASMLKTGQSQHEKITRERMTMGILHCAWLLDDPKRKWYEAFIRDPDAFDRRFFKSPREAVSIDPQGRQALEAAYQAVEQSGYFQELLHGHELAKPQGEYDMLKHVGVYLGSCSIDCDTNISSNEPSAFTATEVVYYREGVALLWLDRTEHDVRHGVFGP